MQNTECGLSYKDRVDFLKNLLDRVDGWTKFAETKNGVLLTFTLAMVAIGLRVGITSKLNSISMCLWLLGVVICFVGVVILIASFVPRINITLSFHKDEFVKKTCSFVNKCGSKFPCRKNPLDSEDVNFIYFASIAKMDLSDFTSGMSGRLLVDKVSFSELEIDLLSQVHINSRIAVSKFQVFIPALFCTLVGATFSFTTIFLHLLR